MQHVEISYENLREADPAYVEKLKTKEPVIRRALRAMGRRDALVRWSRIDTGSGNYAFRLLGGDDRNDCILQVSPLDLTLEQAPFEQALVEGKRACAGVGSEPTEQG